MESHIPGDDFPWLHRPSVRRDGNAERVNKLSRVTGGANGRGEQNKSFRKEDRYTPEPRTMISLLHRVKEQLIRLIARE